MVCIFAQNNYMAKLTPLEEYNNKLQDAKDKLSRVVLPKKSQSAICWEVGASLDITGITVSNYLKGTIRDGFLAIAIYNEFKRRKMLKNINK